MYTASGQEGILEDPANYLFPTSTTMTVPGDVRTYAPIVGVAYNSSYQLSEQFVYDGNQQADTTGRLNLRTLTVNFKDSGFFEIVVYPYGTDYTGYTEEVIPAALDSFTGRTLGEVSLKTNEAAFNTGVYQFYLDGHSRDIEIVLQNNGHLQSKFTSAEWEGKFTKRTRSI